jgi:hypothetical protein
VVINFYSATREEYEGVFDSLVKVLNLLQDASDIKTEKADLIYALYVIHSHPIMEEMPDEAREAIESVLTGENPIEESGEMIIQAVHSIQEQLGDNPVNPDIQSERKD